jgi:hypothetical protein
LNTPETTNEQTGENLRKVGYEKPAIIWEETLEIRQTLAASCGKIGGQGGFCNSAPTS